MKGWKSMKLLIDTNVILDVLLQREPFYENSAEVLLLCQDNKVKQFVSASAITDIYYIANRNLKDKARVKELIQQLLKIVSVAGVTADEILHALDLNWKDFEDAVQYSAAFLANMDGIVTRNPSDYSGATLKIFTPEEIASEFNKK